MRLFSSSGFYAVDYMDGELHLTPIVAFTSRDDDDRRVEPITQSGEGDYVLPHPDRLIPRPDGYFCDQQGRVTADHAVVLERFQNYQLRKNNVRQRQRQSWNDNLLTAPLSTDADGYIIPS
jgi:hypothetical protein